ncbi:MAG: hypothetical protein M3Q40_06065, partial [Pseudomonadota bacterium]|nr:hypothetical protein [Pseudomonadota bacterium]
MSLPWSPQQREWLQALGHPMLVLAADGRVDAPAHEQAGAAEDRRPQGLAPSDAGPEEPHAPDAAPALH